MRNKNVFLALSHYCIWITLVSLENLEDLNNVTKLPPPQKFFSFATRCLRDSSAPCYAIHQHTPVAQSNFVLFSCPKGLSIDFHFCQLDYAGVLCTWHSVLMSHSWLAMQILILMLVKWQRKESIVLHNDPFGKRRQLFSSTNRWDFTLKSHAFLC